MLTYLSDEWIAEADRAVRNDEALGSSTAETALVIQYEVDGGPDGDRSWYLCFDHGSNSVNAGRHPGAEVSFTCDWKTATGIARGDESAQTAFMAGRLRLGGEARSLIHHGPAMTGALDILGSLRANTSFDR